MNTNTHLPEADMIRPMNAQEVQKLVAWAGDEGWNPGVNDAQCFWNFDPDGFLAIAEKYKMQEVFGCVRMYYGPVPLLDHRRIFGVTTLEIG